MRGLTQKACADLTGIRRSTLARFEAEITPIGYDEAKRFCFLLDINQRWLATGLSPHSPYFDVSPNLEFSIKPNSLFSKAFDTVLAGPIQDYSTTLMGLIGEKAFLAHNYDNAVFNNLQRVGEDPATAVRFYVSKGLSIRMQSMPERFKSPFASALAAAQDKFLTEHGGEIKKELRERQKRSTAERAELESEKSAVDNVSISRNIEGVKAKLPH